MVLVYLSNIKIKRHSYEHNDENAITEVVLYLDLLRPKEYYIIY